MRSATNSSAEQKDPSVLHRTRPAASPWNWKPTASTSRCAPSGGTYLLPGDQEWLEWLVRVTSGAGDASGEADEVS